MSGRPVTHLSKKATEMQRARLEFTKPLPTSKALEYTTQLSTKPLKQRSYEPGMALPPGTDIRTRKPYVVGDGDEHHQPVRQGADDHLKCLSLASEGHATYSRGHE